MTIIYCACSINSVFAAETISDSAGTEEITIANSSKIGIFSNSYANGYTIRTHHLLDNLGMWSDYIFYNYGKSGDDVLETLARVNANETFLGSVPVQSWGLTYGVIAMSTNDWGLFSANRETYRENVKKLAEAIRAMGAIPILGTEHDHAEYYYGLMALAQEEGYLFMNWTKSALTQDKFKPFWQNAHPATRTHWLWTYGMKPYLDSLPRPLKGIKLFRKRPGTGTDPESMMFNSVIERSERFVEIYSGYKCLTKETEKYFDRLNNGLTQYEDVFSEYQDLQSGTAVSFGSNALIECITPYTAGNIRTLFMKLDATGVEHAYVRRILSLEKPLPEKRYIAFKVTAGAEILPPAAVFNITDGVFNDNIKGTYTVDQVLNGMLITTTPSINKTTSGTDTPVCDIEGVTLSGSYEYPGADYLHRFDKPLGEWEEITLGEDGTTDLSDHLKKCMDYDKVSILLTGKDIVMNDISFAVAGTSTKQLMAGKAIPVRRTGESLIKDSLLDPGTAWNNIADIPIYTPVVSALDGTSVEPLPKGIKTVRVLHEGESIKQTYDHTKLAGNPYLLDHIQIRVLARYFPEYVDSDEKWEKSDIFEGSYDCAQMSVIIDGTTKCARTPVGAFWNEFVFDIQYEHASQWNHIISVQCDKKNLQIARVEMVLVKD